MKEKYLKYIYYENWRDIESWKWKKLLIHYSNDKVHFFHPKIMSISLIYFLSLFSYRICGTKQKVKTSTTVKPGSSNSFKSCVISDVASSFIFCLCLSLPSFVFHWRWKTFFSVAPDAFIVSRPSLPPHLIILPLFACYHLCDIACDSSRIKLNEHKTFVDFFVPAKPACIASGCSPLTEQKGKQRSLLWEILWECWAKLIIENNSISRASWTVTTGKLVNIFSPASNNVWANDKLNDWAIQIISKKGKKQKALRLKQELTLHCIRYY